MAPSERGGRSARAGRARACAASWLALAAGAACTELAPGADRLERGIRPIRPDASVADPRWACLGQPVVGQASPPVDAVELSLRVTDTITGLTPAQLAARACDKQDVACAMALTPWTSADGDGAVHLEVPRLFDGFVEITGPATVSTMYFLNRALTGDASEALPVVSPVALAGLTQQGNIPLDPALGHLLVRTFDCEGSPASGVELSNDVDGVPFAFVDGLPRVGTRVTTDSGIGGFVNVPVGFAVLQGRRVEGDEVLGTAAVVVRAGWFTYGDVEPLPQ